MVLSNDYGSQLPIDEENEQLMKDMGLVLSQSCLLAFENLENVQFRPSHQLSRFDLNRFLGLIADNLDEYYEKRQGSGWKVNKFSEMQEPGLVYAWCSVNNVLVGFILFKVCNDEDTRVLYLYEIHVDPKYHSQKYGTKFMNSFYELAKNIPNYIDTKSPLFSYFTNIQFTQLTVFSDNLKALDWYTRLGYTYNHNSPLPTTLRSGKVINPEYFILEKLIK